MLNARVKFLILLAASTLIVLRLVRPDLQIDAVTLGLLLLAVLPWLFSFISSAQLPGGWKIEFRQLERVVQDQNQRLEDQQEIINQLIVFSMAQHIFRHLRELYERRTSKEEYLYRNNAEFRRDLIFLRDHGFIESARSNEYLNIDALQDGQNLIHQVKLTPVGNFYVEQRRAKETAVYRGADRG